MRTEIKSVWCWTQQAGKLGSQEKQADVGWKDSTNISAVLGPYDFRDAENADGIVESSHKNGIYSLTQNVTEFVKVWMN